MSQMISTHSSHTPHRLASPSDRVRSLITPLVPQILKYAGGADLVALTVVGSAARSEETWHDEQLVGDIDIAAVVKSPNPLSQGRFQRAAQGLGAGVELGCFPLYSLRRYRTIEFYEAKRTAWILWGRSDVFDCVRIDTAADIPRWEAIRLLLNRAMHCLEARAGLSPSWYAAVKSYLALGEADLIFADSYVPSYQGRWNELNTIGAVFGSRELLERVRWATDMKLAGMVAPTQFEEREHEQWLMIGLETLLSQYLGQEISATDGLERIARRTRHLAHRAAYVARHRFHPDCWSSSLTQDPIFPIWHRAIQILNMQADYHQSDILRLLADWRQTHQPLPR